ncbi:MAG: hypothetical protein WA053_01550 [Minisyncoccia bacterium]
MKPALAQVEAGRRAVKMTVLRRERHPWYQSEIGRLVNGLKTEVSGHSKHPEYLVVFGHYTKEQTLEALQGGWEYTATQVTGFHSPSLPFVPGFT